MSEEGAAVPQEPLCSRKGCGCVVVGEQPKLVFISASAVCLGLKLVPVQSFLVLRVALLLVPWEVVASCICPPVRVEETLGRRHGTESAPLLS